MGQRKISIGRTGYPWTLKNQEYNEKENSPVRRNKIEE